MGMPTVVCCITDGSDDENGLYLADFKLDFDNSSNQKILFLSEKRETLIT